MLDSKLKRTLKCMIIGSLLYNIVLLIVSAIVFALLYRSTNLNNNDKLILIIKNEVCVLIGFICSVISLYSMAMSVSKAVSANDEKYAKNHVAIMSVVRLVTFCIILIIVINEKTFGLTGGIMFALATLGVKVGAYLAPVVEKRMS